MDTLLLKVACVFLFGFIFFQSFTAEYPTTSTQLFSLDTKTIKTLDQKTDVISVDVIHTSLAINETASYWHTSVNN